MNLFAEITSSAPQPLAETSISLDCFREIARIAADEAGLAIPESKMALVQSRISKRMRAIGVETFSDYLKIVGNRDNRDERRELVSVLTTNVSSFFREKHHFDFFAKTVLSHLKTRLAAGGSVRIWSAGCSSGQEPYSIAMECFRADPDILSKDFLILATDIDAQILERAAKGQYSASEIAGIEDADLRRHFETDSNGATYSARQHLRELVRFRELNLHAAWPMRRTFDAIFCRNVVIYFDEAHQSRLWPRFHSSLGEGGYLFLGHSERIHPIDGSGFENSGVTIFKKSQTAHSATPQARK